jgi:hypothetical protein
MVGSGSGIKHPGSATLDWKSGSGFAFVCKAGSEYVYIECASETLREIYILKKE